MGALGGVAFEFSTARLMVVLCASLVICRLMVIAELKRRSSVSVRLDPSFSQAKPPKRLIQTDTIITNLCVKTILFFGGGLASSSPKSSQCHNCNSPATS